MSCRKHSSRALYTCIPVVLAAVVLSCIRPAFGAEPSVVKNLSMDGGPIAMAVDESGGRLFVLNRSDGTLATMNEADYQIINIIPLERRVNRNIDSRAVAFDPANNVIYVTNSEDLIIIDGRSYTVTSDIKGADKGWFIPDLAYGRGKLFLADWNGFVHVYRDGGQFESSFDVGGSGDLYMHHGILNRLYLSTSRQGLVVLDADSGSVAGKLPVEAYSIPESGGGMVFVAGPGKLYIIDAEKLKVEKTLNVDYPGVSGLGMVFNPGTGRLFLITGGDTVTAVDVKRGNKPSILKVCAGPRSLAINRTSNTVYAACPDSGTISVIKDK